MLDPSFTLFGKRIQVNNELDVELEKSSSNEHLHEDEVIKEVTEEETMENDQPDISSAKHMDESTNVPAISETTYQIKKDTDSKTNQDEYKPNDKKNELKKPDKILPCPRCDSMDTKFCYYNNYNANQPRHFCKKCQRYWTAGGTMRNVPVGAGRRKNKSSASRYYQTLVEVANGVHHPDGLKTNGTVLTFGSDNPVPDRSSVFHNNNIRGRENGDDHSSGSTVTTNSIEDRLKKCAQESNQQFNGFPNQMQSFQWPYLWNPAIPYFPSAYPMPIYPHPYWNGAPFPCNAPWLPEQKNSESNPNPPTLGKHTRDGEVKSPSTVLVPKTLRIDDPDEAAKSSIWTTLGIKKDKSDPVRKGFFNSLHSKGLENNDCEIEALPSLIKANPVALCRSFRFQERAVQ